MFVLQAMVIFLLFSVSLLSARWGVFLPSVRTSFSSILVQLASYRVMMLLMVQAYFLVHQVAASIDQHILQLLAIDDPVSGCIANDKWEGSKILKSATLDIKFEVQRALFQVPSSLLIITGCSSLFVSTLNEKCSTDGSDGSQCIPNMSIKSSPRWFWNAHS